MFFATAVSTPKLCPRKGREMVSIFNEKKKNPKEWNSMHAASPGRNSVKVCLVPLIMALNEDQIRRHEISTAEFLYS